MPVDGDLNAGRNAVISKLLAKKLTRATGPRSKWPHSRKLKRNSGINMINAWLQFTQLSWFAATIEESCL